MAKQVKIRDIANLAGVSTGTVDRILHNRGRVSKASQEAVEKVLNEIGYKYNIHTSAISLKKRYDIIITTPYACQGEYWGHMQDGIEEALDEFSDIDIICTYVPYNQFDVFSCISAFNHITEKKADAVVIGPTFIQETKDLCDKLDEAGTPYVFVDSEIDGTNPLASFSTDKYSCGKILARMLLSGVGDNGDIALFDSIRLGNQPSTNTAERKQGFMDFIGETAKPRKVLEASFSATSQSDNEESVTTFLANNPSVKGIAVLNSRGYIIAEMLRNRGINGMSVVAFDLTDNNIKCLNDGSISSLICQRPTLQGFLAIETTIKYLLYKQTSLIEDQKIPIDIIVKENLPFHKEINEI